MLLGKLKGSKMLEMLLTVYKRNTPKYLQTYDHLVSQLKDVLREQQTDAARARQLKDIDNLNNRLDWGWSQVVVPPGGNTQSFASPSHQHSQLSVSHHFHLMGTSWFG